MKQFDWKLKTRFQHVPDHVLQGEHGVETILRIMDDLAGEREGDDKRKAARECLFEFARA